MLADIPEGPRKALWPSWYCVRVWYDDLDHSVLGILTISPAAGEVRLAGGPGPWTGRVEIHHSGVWGTVCDDDFSDVDATVVCRQLGMQNGQVTPFMTPGSGAIMMDSVHCSGNELMLAHCAFDGWFSNDCTHEEDVEVHCSE